MNIWDWMGIPNNKETVGGWGEQEGISQWNFKISKRKQKENLKIILQMIH